MSAQCPHFGECGGCQSQDLSYAEQLEAKQAMLQELFASFWHDPVSVTPSPVVWHYRNKVDPTFAPMRYPEPPPDGFQRETVLGFKKRGRWFWPLDIEDCLIGPEGLGKLLEAVRQWYRDEALHAFDAKSGEGFLRTLLVRDGKRSGERMLVLITRPGDFNPASFLQTVQESFAPHSIWHGTFSGLADVAAADELTLLAGSETITETLRVPGCDRDLHFRVSPFSFFQTNSLAAEQLYGQIRQWVREQAPSMLYDLYGGAGGIAFSCHDLVEKVHSVENVPEASEDGRFNAATNKIENVTFTTEKVKNYLKERIRRGPIESDAAIIVDPPRSGMVPKATRRLVELSAPHVLYVSCNPKILARELPLLLECYELTALNAVDMFPHTRHVEVVAGLRLR